MKTRLFLFLCILQCFTAISRATDLPYKVTDVSTQLNLEFLYQEILRRGFDNQGEKKDALLTFSESSACAKATVFDSQAYILYVDSVPTIVSPGFVTITPTNVPNNAKMIYFKTIAISTQNASGELSEVNLCLRATGNASSTCNTLTGVNFARSDLADEVSVVINYLWHPVNSSQQFDFSCRTSGTLNKSECLLIGAGYCQ